MMTATNQQQQQQRWCKLGFAAAEGRRKDGRKTAATATAGAQTRIFCCGREAARWQQDGGDTNSSDAKLAWQQQQKKDIRNGRGEIAALPLTKPHFKP